MKEQARGKNADVAVIIPYYEAHGTIERALESIFNQTVLPAQILIVDDGSSAFSKKCLKQICERYNHDLVPISLFFSEKNRGASTARNTGLRRANAEYVAFLDADDVWHPLKIQVQVSYMEANPDVRFSAHIYSEFPVKEEELPEPDVTVFTFKSFLLRNRCSTPTVMLKRPVNIRFKVGKRYSEDFHFWANLVASGLELHFLNVALAWGEKRAFGESGLSKHIYLMEIEKVKTLVEFYREKRIGPLILLFLVCFSCVKVSRRQGLVILRKISSGLDGASRRIGG